MLKIRAIISKSPHYFGLVQFKNIIIFSNRFFQKTFQDKLLHLTSFLWGECKCGLVFCLWVFLGFLAFFLTDEKTKMAGSAAQYDSQHPMHWKILIINNLGSVYISDDIWHSELQISMQFSKSWWLKIEKKWEFKTSLLCGTFYSYQ